MTVPNWIWPAKPVENATFFVRLGRAVHWLFLVVAALVAVVALTIAIVPEAFAQETDQELMDGASEATKQAIKDSRAMQAAARQNFKAAMSEMPKTYTWEEFFDEPAPARGRTYSHEELFGEPGPAPARAKIAEAGPDGSVVPRTYTWEEASGKLAPVVPTKEQQKEIAEEKEIAENKALMRSRMASLALLGVAMMIAAAGRILRYLIAAE